MTIKTKLKYALVGALLTSIGLFLPPPAQAQDAPAKTAAEDYSLLYPRPDELFGIRTLGSANAPNKITFLLAPGFGADHYMWRDLYPQLLPLINGGKVKVEINLFGHNQMGLPAYLIAACVDPATVGDYLYLLSGDWDKIIKSKDEVSKSLKDIALSNAEFIPVGLTPAQFERRLDWCLTNRRAGLIASETRRFTAIYNGNYSHGGAVFIPVVIVNDKVFEGGMITMDVLKGEMK